MDPFVRPFLTLVETQGEWILFLLAVLETCFVTGLAVPSGLATSLATVLALEGLMTPWMVAVAAVSGGAVGDSLGFWIGRWGGERLQGTRLLRRLAPEQREASRFFGRHPFFSVTVARLVSFVRTLMPLTAGMSDLPYLRFLAYEAVGVVVWAAMYMAIGWLAGESWQTVTSLVGAGWAVVFAVGGTVLWVSHRRRRRRLGGGGGRTSRSPAST